MKTLHAISPVVSRRLANAGIMLLHVGSDYEWAVTRTGQFMYRRRRNIEREQAWVQMSEYDVSSWNVAIERSPELNNEERRAIAMERFCGEVS